MVELNEYLLLIFFSPHSNISFAAPEEVHELVSTSSKLGVSGCSWSLEELASEVSHLLVAWIQQWGSSSRALLWAGCPVGR